MRRLRLLVILVGAALAACDDAGGGGDDMTVRRCTGSAIDACEQQCAPGLNGGICYPDPVCEPTGEWKCFCQPCNGMDLSVRRD